MNHPLLFLTLTLGTVATLQAQVQIPVNPRATYIRVSNDPSAVPAPAIPLSAIGLVPGQLASISAVGGYSISSGADTNRNLICVFSSSATLLTGGNLVRVPDAIAAGPAAVTTNTAFSSLPTDIPQDFLVARTSWRSGTLVRVPAAATHLFLSVWSTSPSFFGNLSDPNSDFAAVFAAGTPATLQGSAEHAELLTAVNGTPTLTPDVKPAAPFTTVSVEVGQRYGVNNGDLWALAANVFTTGGALPMGPLPDLHLGSGFLIVQSGVVTTAAGQWSFFVPPGFAGTSLVLQGAILEPTSRNGLLMASDAHRIELQ
jgi:hypothetical protein